MMWKRRILLAAVALLGAYTVASVAAIYWYSEYRIPCAQPCRELGEEVLVPPRRRDDDAVYRPKCKPLQLDLELYRPKARADTRYTLWYKARLVNRSCFALYWIDSGDFMYSLDQIGAVQFTDNGLSFRVIGPDGVEVPQGGFFESSEFEFIYRADREELARVDSTYDEFRRNFPPGAEIRTVASELAPHKSYLVIPDADAIRKMTGFSHDTALRPAAPPPGTEAPPPGFRILDAYRFKRKGTYRIQAAYRDDLTAVPLRLSVDTLPPWLTLPVRIIERFGLSVTWPDPEFVLHRYRVEATSVWKEFRVE